MPKKMRNLIAADAKKWIADWGYPLAVLASLLASTVAVIFTIFLYIDVFIIHREPFQFVPWWVGLSYAGPVAIVFMIVSDYYNSLKERMKGFEGNQP